METKICELNYEYLNMLDHTLDKRGVFDCQLNDVLISGEFIRFVAEKPKDLSTLEISDPTVENILLATGMKHCCTEINCVVTDIIYRDDVRYTRVAKLKRVDTNTCNDILQARKAFKDSKLNK